MSSFDPSWLALREGYDHAVRDRGLTDAFVAVLGPSPKLMDLGCGTGSNLRYLSPHLDRGQRWTCVDYDPALLEKLEVTKPKGINVEGLQMDLAQDLESLEVMVGMGVTSTALLDLCSAAWLDHLAQHCRKVPLLMTLIYDGRMIWSPHDPDDEAINAAFNQHQRSDKGFGPALGPDAASHMAEALEAVGHDVRQATSDWIFDAEDGVILSAMVTGITAAAKEYDPSLPIDAWRTRRQHDIATRALSLTVGHLDLLAIP